MQTDSSTSKTTEVTSKPLLNVNAPVFEPRFASLTSKSSDPIWSNFQIPGNSKSTILVQPLRQSTNTVSVNCPAYVLPSFNPNPSLKVDYTGHTNGGPTAFYCVPQYYIDPTAILTPSQPSQIISLPHNTSTLNKAGLHSSTIIDPKEIPISSQICITSPSPCPPSTAVPLSSTANPSHPLSSSHSRNDQSIFSQPIAATPSLNFGINQNHLHQPHLNSNPHSHPHPSFVLHQTNLSPLWQSCAQSSSSSQPVALFPTSYYPTTPPHNVFFFHPPQIFAPLQHNHLSLQQHCLIPALQNRSASKISIRNKVFNTGDPNLDKVLNELVKRINPVDEFVFRSKNSRFFVIKSFTEDNIYQSIVHGVWCSTPTGNEALDSAYKEVKSRELTSVHNDDDDEDGAMKAHVYLFFSVNGSGYFCGVAEMTSGLLFSTTTSSASSISTTAATVTNIWNQKKWQNQFNVNWLYIKDVPNSYLRQVKLESNDNRPVTNCRDATEILPIEKGIEVLRIIHNIHYDTCLLNDFMQDSTKQSQPPQPQSEMS